MTSLNYHHLFYFWTVAREGSIARAARLLRLSEPTIGAQVHALEDALGEKLFERRGRLLELTETGQVTYRYATDIFTLGRELQAAVKGSTEGTRLHLRVGIADIVPRLVAFRLLEPAFLGLEPVEISCRNDSPSRLSRSLAKHDLDVVISDAPPDSSGKVPTQDRLLGESGLTIFGTETLENRLRRGFPGSLDKAPFLLPPSGTRLRRALDAWFAETKITPWVRAELTDNALLETFGRAGIGAFAAPTAIEREVGEEYRVRVIGRIESVRQRFFAISAQRKVAHPVVATIMHSARTGLFD